MAVYTMTKSYNTKGNMGMIDVTEDFREAVRRACQKKNINDGIITGFTTGGVAALTTLEFEPGMVTRDLKKALDIISPYLDKDGRVVYTNTMRPGATTTDPVTSNPRSSPRSSRFPS